MLLLAAGHITLSDPTAQCCSLDPPPDHCAGVDRCAGRSGGVARASVGRAGSCGWRRYRAPTAAPRRAPLRPRAPRRHPPMDRQLERNLRPTMCSRTADQTWSRSNTLQRNNPARHPSQSTHAEGVARHASSYDSSRDWAGPGGRLSMGCACHHGQWELAISLERARPYVSQSGPRTCSASATSGPGEATRIRSRRSARGESRQRSLAVRYWPARQYPVLRPLDGRPALYVPVSPLARLRRSPPAARSCRLERRAASRASRSPPTCAIHTTASDSGSGVTR